MPWYGFSLPLFFQHRCDSVVFFFPFQRNGKITWWISLWWHLKDFQSLLIILAPLQRMSSTISDWLLVSTNNYLGLHWKLFGFLFVFLGDTFHCFFFFLGSTIYSLAHLICQSSNFFCHLYIFPYTSEHYISNCLWIIFIHFITNTNSL